MAREQSTSTHAHTSTNSDNSTTRYTTSGRALRLVPNVGAESGDTRCILQSDLLLAAFDWTEERGWQISYYIDELPAELQGEAWRARYFDGAEKPITTSDAATHPSLRLLGEGSRMAVWRIARTVLHQLEAALTGRIEADAGAA
jgi:hypothetical protein